jgi:hypothetical protein
MPEHGPPERNTPGKSVYPCIKGRVFRRVERKTTGGMNESWAMGKIGVSVSRQNSGRCLWEQKCIKNRNVSNQWYTEPTVETYPSVHPKRRRRYVSCSSRGERRGQPAQEMKDISQY